MFHDQLFKMSLYDFTSLKKGFPSFASNVHKKQWVQRHGSSSKFPSIVAYSICCGAFFPSLGLLFLFLFQELGLRKIKFFRWKGSFWAFVQWLLQTAWQFWQRAKAISQAGSPNWARKTHELNVNDLQKDHEWPIDQSLLIVLFGKFRKSRHLEG